MGAYKSASKLWNILHDSRQYLCNCRCDYNRSTDRYLDSGILARFCPAPLYKIIKPATELLAGIPSIVYGFSD